jgi:hypothetical protein
MLQKTSKESEQSDKAYFRLIDQRRVDRQNRAHFFAVAARLMLVIAPIEEGGFIANSTKGNRDE